MYPILYEQITAGTVPAHNGLGVLSDCISCTVEQAKNGIYEITIEYPLTGLHAEEIAERRVIKVKPNFTDPPQLFRINRVGKVMNGKFTIYGKHISYDLSGCELTSGTATSAAATCTLFQNAATGYTITTDKTVSATFKVTEPASVRAYFAGREGSFLDVYGKTEIKYDNFNVQFLQHAGTNRGVTIMYGKNLLELSQELDCSNLCTHVIGYYKGSEGTLVQSDKKATGLTLDVPKTLIVDFSSEYSEAPSVSTLNTRTQKYIDDNNLTTPKNNIKLNFAQSEELANRVDLCDTVNVYYEALGITRANVQCIRVKWDCLKEKYIETEFGDVKSSAADTIAIGTKAIEERPTSSAMSNAIAHATELITGNLGGYVVMHDSNGDGKPDEILIMNTEDISTANQVWRFNKSGLGYSTSYSGSYGLALTSDGQIVADRITSGTLDCSRITVEHISGNSIDTGVLNANLIKAGIIQDVAGNSSINMENGSATMKDFYSKGSFTLIDSNSKDRAKISMADANHTTMTLSAADSKKLVELDGNNAGISYLTVYGKNTSDMQVPFVQIIGNSLAHYGSINITSNGRNTITMLGDTGVITCVRCDETSSIKVKKNVKPITDASKILELQAVEFDFKNEKMGTDQRGFIAEDVAEILPNLVSGGETPSIHYTGMIPYLQAVIKDQAAQIKKLDERIAALEKMLQSDKGE